MKIVNVSEPSRSFRDDVMVSGIKVSSRPPAGETTERFGLSAIALTVTVNVSVSRPPVPSLAMTVMVDVPDWLATGVTITVRLEPVPPRKCFPWGSGSCWTTCRKG